MKRHIVTIYIALLLYAWTCIHMCVWACGGHRTIILLVFWEGISHWHIENLFYSLKCQGNSIHFHTCVCQYLSLSHSHDSTWNEKLIPFIAQNTAAAVSEKVIVFWYISVPLIDITILSSWPLNINTLPVSNLIKFLILHFQQKIFWN